MSDACESSCGLLQYNLVAVVTHLHNLLYAETRTELQEHADGIPVNRPQYSISTSCR